MEKELTLSLCIKRKQKYVNKEHIDQYNYYLSREIYSNLDACLSLETRGVFLGHI